MAKKPVPYTYEDWRPGKGMGPNPFYVREISQAERVDIFKQSTMPEDFPKVLSKIANQYPGMALGNMVGMAQIGADEETLKAVARLDAITNNTPAALNNMSSGASMLPAGEAGQKYLAALGKTEETASEKDKQDAWQYAGLKGAVRYLMTGLYSGLQLITNTARQLDAAYNVWNDKGKIDKGPVVAGELATDFSQIFKDTYLYQNLVEKKSLGEGFFPGGDAVAETERIAAQIATVNGKAYTPGRAIEGMMGIDPGERGHGVISGLIDAVIAFRLDPFIGLGRWKAAKDVAKESAKVLEGGQLAGRVRAGYAAEAEEITNARNLARSNTAQAQNQMRLSEQELLEQHAQLIEEARVYDQMVAEGKLATTDTAIETARKNAGLDSLYEQRDRILGQIDEFKNTKEIIVRDAQESKVLTGGAGAKFLREQLADNTKQINNALDKIYVERDPVAVQILNRVRDEIKVNADNFAARLREQKDPQAIQRLVEANRAGVYDSATGFRMDLDKAKDWFAQGNADEVFQRIADETSPSAILKMGNGRWKADLAADLARATTVDDVERVILTQLGIKILPEVPRGLPGRYIAEPLKELVLKTGVNKLVSQKIKKFGKFLFDYMPTGRAIHLQDTDGLVEETRRWMTATRANQDDISKVLDDIILSDPQNYAVRQNIVINVLKSTASRYKKELGLTGTAAARIDRAVAAYSSELSGMREYGSQVAGDVFRKVMNVNGEEIDLSGIPSSISQLAHEIVLPDAYELRRLTGLMGKLSRYVDSKVSADKEVAEKVTFAAARWSRHISDGFLRQILLAYRGAYIVRNILEMQARSFLSGGQNIFTNPIATITLMVSNKSVSTKMAELARMSDPYLVDINGVRFMQQNLNDYIGQDIFDSFAHNQAARGFSADGRAFASAVRSGEFGLMRFTGTNAKEYSQALTYRFLMHHADPMKRAIATQTLPSKYQKLVATGKMEFEEAFIQAVRDGVFRNQVDILTKSVPEIRRILNTNEGMRLFFFDGPDSYRAQVLTDTLGNVEWKNFIGTGKITVPVKRTVKNPETGKLEEVLEDKVIFEMGQDFDRNVKNLKNIIERNLSDANSVEYANATNLSIPAIMEGTFSGGYRKFMDLFFRNAARIENIAVYGPEYRTAYWKAVGELAPLMSREAAQKFLASTDDIKKTMVAIDQADGTVKFEKWLTRNPVIDDIKQAAKGDGYLTQREIDDYARDRASKQVASLYYDATQKKNIAYAMQLIVPFANAWGNTLYKWGELGSNPSRIGSRVLPATRLFNTLQSDESSVIYDVLGTPHDPTQGFIYENTYGEKVFTVPLTGYLLTAFGAFGDPRAANATIPVTSLNLVAAGASLPGTEIGITPGIGTQWNMVYSFLPMSWKESVPPVVANIIAPYGDRSGNVLAPLPAWLQKVASGTVGTEQAMLKFARPIMAWEVTSNPKYKPLFDGTPLSIEERAALQEELAVTSMEKSRFQYFMQGLLQNVSAGTPVIEYYAKNQNGDTFFQWQMAQALNKLFDVYDGNFELALAEFGTVFGRQAVMASMSSSEGSIFANDRAWQFASNNPSAFRAYGDVIPYFFVGGDFSNEYRRAMQRRGYGKPLSTKELIAEADSLTLAAIKGQLSIEAARNGYGANWIDQQMKKYKMNTLQGYEPEITINTNKMAQRILKVESALKRPEFASTDAGKAAVQYSQVRNEALKVAQMRYPDRKNPSLSGADNADLRYQLEALGNSLSQSNPDFANMFQRVYLPELRKN